jgi:hypothetical protein
MNFGKSRLVLVCSPQPLKRLGRSLRLQFIATLLRIPPNCYTIFLPSLRHGRTSPHIAPSPSLLPTLTTGAGEAINSLYTNYHARTLQLGAARNACLSHAADAWRRGDGAAATPFSGEGHDLNVKMSVRRYGQCLLGWTPEYRTSGLGLTLPDDGSSPSARGRYWYDARSTSSWRRDSSLQQKGCDIG